MWSKLGLEMVYIERFNGFLMFDFLIWFFFFKGVLCDYNQKYFKFFSWEVNCFLVCFVMINYVVLNCSSV